MNSYHCEVADIALQILFRYIRLYLPIFLVTLLSLFQILLLQQILCEMSPFTSLLALSSVVFPSHEVPETSLEEISGSLRDIFTRFAS